MPERVRARTASRRLRVPLGAAALAVTAPAAAVAGLVGGAGWLYSGRLLPAVTRDRTRDLVAEVRGDTVLLPDSPRTRVARTGVEFDGGAFGQAHGPVRERADGQVERDFTALVGEPPTGRAHARLDPYAFPSHPSHVGLAHRDVVVPGPLGDAPAWVVPGESDTWVVAVHGRGADRGEALRLLPAAVAEGCPALVITYRNDGEAPSTDDRVLRFGATEWEDLAAAVDWARSQGARQVVPVGYSMGGSLVAFLLRHRGTEGVAGVILDAPLLSLGATLLTQGRASGLRGPVLSSVLFGTRTWARLRAAFDPMAVEHVAALTDLLDVPCLLFHGALDETTPPEPSDALAAARPDVVRYHRVDGAGHVESWNADPDAYTAAVRGFLRAVAR